MHTASTRPAGDGRTPEPSPDGTPVTSIRVLYPDLHGVARGKDVPIGEFDHVIEKGLCFCAAVMGTDLRNTPVVGGEEGYPDLIARPDMSTMVTLPWEPGVASCLADLEPAAGGRPIADPRGTVRRAVAALAELDYEPIVGPELEFFLVERDASAPGGIRRRVDQLSMVYTVGPRADPGGLVRGMTEALSQLGLEVFASNHEFMNSQYEISLRHSEAHMQEVLNTEYGGMNEVLYNLAAATGNDRYAAVGDRFTKKWFFNPLALRRDELRGLHVNTHIPQVIGAARRYEISRDMRFHDVADFFWYEVTSARTYVTGGTSNAELWRAEPRHLGEELKLSSNTNECCCAYNMLKLTRHLYRWTADPRYFDYYERTLYNHRLGAIDVENGATQYYLSIVPGAWRTFSKENDSFWCCTGTGVEEFAKLNSSIYFHDDDGLFVNLFIPSEAHWRQKGIKIGQETNFPESPRTALVIGTSKPVHMPLHLRIPYWVGREASVRINGKLLESAPSPGSYLTITRTWRDGDRIELDLPMYLHVEAMPDEATTQAVLYGPLVLAGKLGADGLTQEMTVNHAGPDVAHHPMEVPTFRPSSGEPNSWLEPVAGEPLTFRTKGQQRDITLAPFNRLSGERYSIYWTVNESA